MSQRPPPVGPDGFMVSEFHPDELSKSGISDYNHGNAQSGRRFLPIIIDAMKSRASL